MKKLTLFTLFIFPFMIFFSQSIKGFHIPDSLKNKNYSQLQKAYDKVFRIDNNKAELYANSILFKGKKEKNNNIIYDGYYKIAHTKGLKSENGHPYADSLINITKSVHTKEYPAKAHIIKGILLNYEFKYSEALNHYIQAQNLSKNKNPDQFFYIKKLIGILKTATDENKEALPLFLEYYNYQKQNLNTNNKDIKSYIGSIASISGSYNKNTDYNKSKFYNNLGLIECKKYNDYTHYIYFIMLEGVADYYLKNYSKSLANLLKTEKVLIKNKDLKNLSIVYYCLGKIYYETNKEKEAISFFLKSDSLSFISDDFLPKTRDRYEILIDYYKKRGDKESQLKFINKLFYADSIINTSRQYLSKEIYKKYDTPILLEKKEDLINDLNNKNTLLYWCLAVGFVILSILFFMFIKNKKKIQEYQKQAELLLRKSTKPIDALAQVQGIKDDRIKENNSDLQKSKTTIPKTVLLELKTHLEMFETNKEFLHKNITIEGLAKKFGTNRDYLSKSVNELKGKNFSQYVNELRINYIVEELKTDVVIRKHTISAIAEDIGFNNSESFSNAFKKITGTLPSYYIKLLQTQKIENEDFVK
ncbi:AraC family transcriptional regulator [Chryseobacterium shandongense]|uniref:AraC family transcriptional regulator n=1 Tax=Chryseobacterium shandongense TaxID=1493872 RepID=A0AAD0YED3_9FLAO|nr:helix-turn-helix transcriptional regulator [Chryseobacterium shandongense]AZA87475.1 AraC family transcriptional regulator [Chryseobacterium shandongense]AZA95976.1 AraC family transcriptional regulator [Chryseobacterium shandongense]